MPVVALFGIENDALNTVVSLLVLFLAVVWLALVFYTYKDAVRRISDPLLVTTATLTSFIFPFVGTIVYLILRPPEYLDDVRERELEIAASEARLLQMHELACPYCSFPVERTFLRCPNCLKRLKEPCPTCRKPLDPRWQICPYCEAEVRRGAQPQQQQQRRRRTAGGERQPAPTGSSPAAARGERQAARTAARPQQPTAAQAGGSPGAPGEEAAPSRQRTAPPRPPQQGAADGRSTERLTGDDRRQGAPQARQAPPRAASPGGVDEATGAGSERSRG